MIEADPSEAFENAPQSHPPQWENVSHRGNVQV